MGLLVGLRNLIGGQRSFLLFSIFIEILLLSLGTWQVFRLYEKKDLIAQINSVIHAQPAPPSSPLFDFTPVVLKGHFLDRPAFELLAKPFEGRMGRHIVSAFQTDEGQIIMVLRGWISEGITPPPPSETTLTGTLRHPHKLSAFAPENTPNAWYTLNLDDMGRALHLTVEPYYVVMDSSSGGDEVVSDNELNRTEPSEGGASARPDAAIVRRPRGDEAVNVDNLTATTVAAGPVPRPRGDEVVSVNQLKTLPQVPEIPNNHLQYIMTWYCLAVAVAFAAVVKFRSLRKDAPTL